MLCYNNSTVRCFFMLKLKNIKKNYKIAGSDFTALHAVNLTFSKAEFVAILGPSGCGKTTLLNIIGGLDQYTDGDLIIEGKSTKNFKDNDWDYYRNNKVGFIFQNYHLINHVSIIENVEMGMALSGIPVKERRQRAIEVLKRVGLEDQMYKKSNQLSGGQKQRVAIARALSNNPEIILADEPTGALDTKTSIQILDLIREISKETLVIMVTHNKDLAKAYATRTINLLDGNVVSDTQTEVAKTSSESTYQPKKTSMSYLQSLKLSFRNLITKKGRTLTTAFAGSIGIIGVLLVLALGNGFNSLIRKLETDSLAGVPLMVTKIHQDLNIRQYLNEPEDTGAFKTYNQEDRTNESTYKNPISHEYVEYLTENLNPETFNSIELGYGFNPVFLQEDSSGNAYVIDSQNVFQQLDADFMRQYYNPLVGDFPDQSRTDVFEVVILVNNYYQVDERVLKALGIENLTNVKYEDVLGKKIVLPRYNDYFYRDTTDPAKPVYQVNTDLDAAYENGLVLEVVGVLKTKEDATFAMNDGIYGSQTMAEAFIKMAQSSDIGIEQQTANYLLYSLPGFPAGTPFIYNPINGKYEGKEETLITLGVNDVPIMIAIYPNSYEDKQAIRAVLDEYNLQFDPDSDQRVLYTDIAETVGTTLGQVVNMIQIVLVIFASISLVVSSIMIGIITYVSVIERTQEIGILRALGARKKDIKRVFNSETFLIGLTSGIIGSLISFILTFPLNHIIKNIEPMMANVLQMTIMHAGVMTLISVILTFIAGLIPSAMAARKHPVDALRHNE